MLETTSEKPVRRWRLFLPIALLGLVFAGWSAFWVHVHSRTEAQFSALMAREAANGRQWTCLNAAFGGYPFRLELRCSDVTLVRDSGNGPPLRLGLGGLAAVTQIWSPGHVIAESPGPLTIAGSDGAARSLDWSLAQASLRFTFAGVDRASIVLDRPVFSATPGGAAGGPSGARRVELHLRRQAVNASPDQSLDVALDATDVTAPLLESLIRNGQPMNVALTAKVGRADLLSTGIRPVTLTAWRQAGAVVSIERLTARKGPSELALAGTLGLDDLNRVRGRITASQIGISELGGVKIGALLGLGGLLAATPQTSLPSGHKPLPPVELRDGRVYLGPVRVPDLRLDPLF